jgi:hypothetical protein
MNSCGHRKGFRTKHFTNCLAVVAGRKSNLLRRPAYKPRRNWREIARLNSLSLRLCRGFTTYLTRSIKEPPALSAGYL